MLCQISKCDAVRAVLITIAVIFFMLFLGLLVWFRCCRKDNKILPTGLFNAKNRILVFKKQQEVLIKRCDQSSTNEVESHIINRLKRDIQRKGSRLVERAWDQVLDKGQEPLIVFCVISSRIGTDIENATMGVHHNSRVILVLLHCVLSSLLRGDLSDDEELLNPTMINRISGIVHFAFSDREGLYECHQNSLGFKKLLDLCY